MIDYNTYFPPGESGLEVRPEDTRSQPQSRRGSTQAVQLLINPQVRLLGTGTFKEKSQEFLRLQRHPRTSAFLPTVYAVFGSYFLDGKIYCFSGLSWRTSLVQLSTPHPHIVHPVEFEDIPA